MMEIQDCFSDFEILKQHHKAPYQNQNGDLNLYGAMETKKYTYRHFCLSPEKFDATLKDSLQRESKPTSFFLTRQLPFINLIAQRSSLRASLLNIGHNTAFANV